MKKLNLLILTASLSLVSAPMYTQAATAASSTTSSNAAELKTIPKSNNVENAVEPKESAVKTDEKNTSDETVNAANEKDQTHSGVVYISLGTLILIIILLIILF